MANCLPQIQSLPSPQAESQVHGVAGGTSLVAQWLRVCASAARTCVQFLVGKLRSCMAKK